MKTFFVKRISLFISLLVVLQLSCLADGKLRYIDWTKGKEIEIAHDWSIPDSVTSWYKEDAAHLALRDVHKFESAKDTLIEIPADLIELYYNGLIHIYKATSIASRDSVVDIYKIHAWPYPETHSLIVSVDSTKDWVSAWKNGERFTGNSQIDELMELYDLQLDRYYGWRWRHIAVLESDNPLNIFALAQEFENIKGVGFAEPNGYCCGRRYDITASIENSYLSYEYSVGYGDCPAGCIARHYWVFRVFYHGAVKFVESYGDPAP